MTGHPEEVTWRPSHLAIVIQKLWPCQLGTVTRLEVQETKEKNSNHWTPNILKQLILHLPKETHWGESVKQGPKTLVPSPTLRTIQAETVPAGSMEGEELSLVSKGPGSLNGLWGGQQASWEEGPKSRSKPREWKQRSGTLTSAASYRNFLTPGWTVSSHRSHRVTTIS